MKSLKVKLRNISQGAGFFKEVLLGSDLTIEGKDFSVDSLPIWQVSPDAATDAYGVYVSYVGQSGKETTVYQTFFRVVEKNMLTTYVINKEAYHGITTYALDGGMSAEYTIEKAIENLSGGVAHSWQVNAPGSGPRPVYATPQFLKNAVERTVELYNNVLGQNTDFETVILSTGFPAVPNLNHALRAPVLPLHFLVSANTIKEIKSIMDYSNQNGFKSYSTLGYDLSVPTAVAWIKLLDLPEAYLTFLKQHHVKNILLMGATGINEGETKAKGVISQSAGKYAPGSIYILYPGNTENDITTLQQKIRDINEFSQQSDYTKIADWESGVTNDQIENITIRIKGTISINVYAITADDLINLYNLGTYATLALFKKTTSSQPALQ